MDGWRTEYDRWRSALQHLKRVTVLAVFCIGCGPIAGNEATISDADKQKIRFDLSTLNEDGLRGPPDGFRSLTYEFCIPAEQSCLDEVTRIDPTAQSTIGSHGRIHCPPDRHLVMGNTHQTNFRVVLFRLAGLTYVERIEESFFEH